MLDTYTGRENESFQSLKIYPMKTLAFEEKAPGEIFEEYDHNSMMIKVNFWRSGLEALNEEALKPIEIKVRKDMPIGELQARLVEENKKATNQVWLPCDVKVLKRNPLLNTSHLEVLSEQPDKLLNQLRINEGVNLFVENKNIPHPTGLHIGESEKEGLINTTGTIDTPKWEIEHELDGLRFQVKFNSPTDPKAITPETAITAQQIHESLNEIYKHYMILDRRMSVLDLKIKISTFLGIGLHELVFRRGGAHGVELLEDEDSLKQA